MMMSTENLNTLDQSVTMSSREIAKLTGITHGEVKRLIKSLETAQRLTQPIMINLYEHEGEMRQEYCLNKRDSLFAVARLSPGFTAEALDRWQDREKNAHLPDFTNPAAAARAWAEQFEQRQAAEQQLALSAPKAEFFDRFVQVEESLGFRQLCKMLKVKETEFRQFLLERNIMYRANGALTPQHYHLQAGYFTLHSGVGENQHAFSQARFTAKGVKWVAGLWAGHLATQPKGAAA
ncbi:phage antirepressor KilAC domain-containing protein [Pantoea sp. LMR881]|uniref:phage antirepressor KilAC domain-containing protein n=1 Tax=Pantoea sp. LMR881 TaxID=3014336 RepID=UPI0022AF6F27|nr:phage antirepressor KilAC domain-containing protein [Pantoea sp. LMR881]MCZ4057949.1 phage antirepressor KilAC domain-containing protein [Pantoea sp. LMR881]